MGPACVIAVAILTSIVVYSTDSRSPNEWTAVQADSFWTLGAKFGKKMGRKLPWITYVDHLSSKDFDKMVHG